MIQIDDRQVAVIRKYGIPFPLLKYPLPAQMREEMSEMLKKGWVPEGPYHLPWEADHNYRALLWVQPEPLQGYRYSVHAWRDSTPALHRMVPPRDILYAFGVYAKECDMRDTLLTLRKNWSNGLGIPAIAIAGVCFVGLLTTLLGIAGPEGWWIPFGILTAVFALISVFGPVAASHLLLERRWKSSDFAEGITALLRTPEEQVSTFL